MRAVTLRCRDVRADRSTSPAARASRTAQNPKVANRAASLAARAKKSANAPPAAQPDLRR
ncbi:hypothetical protein P355_4757 [Burkholderia cenocepacia KC-01]|nr:hypothetical protein P355_4757 [Burkholderia cenocepacia KC-01]